MKRKAPRRRRAVRMKRNYQERVVIQFRVIHMWEEDADEKEDEKCTIMGA